MTGGYTNKVLRVNLSDSSISTETTDELFCRRYIGGAGFAAYYLLNELKPGTDPLGPDNKLVFALGPVTGTPLPGSGRNCVGAKSPLTGGFGKSEVGGYWGAELKQAGYDAIVIDGRAEQPTYLWIHDGEVSLRKAHHLWGKNTKETQQTLKAELGDNLVRVAAIGPAGEHLVRFSCIINDLHNAAGRGGLGAVMGSKNLKAIAVRGHQRPQVAYPERLKEFSQWLLANSQLWDAMHEFGTGGMMDASRGNLPVRNFRDGEFAEAASISGQAIKDTIRVKMESCYACPIRCKKVVRLDEPYSIDPAYGGPEYETLAGLGSNCGIGDLNAVAKGNELCNAYSLDTISTGGVIAFAMECFENGLLGPEDTGGIDLRFGNAEAMLRMIELIARREGIGNLLAEGTARAAEKIGKGAMQYAVQVKGLEAGMHEPRLSPALGLGYAVNPHGADHCANLHDSAYTRPGRQLDRVKPLGILEPLSADGLDPRKVSLFRYTQQKQIALDTFVLCIFLPYDLQQVVNILDTVTGWHTSAVEVLRVGERVLTMAREFNRREGFTAADDELPQRFFQPKTSGVLSDKPYNQKELERGKRYYYTLMGWDAETGIPTPEKLEELEIDMP